MMRKTKKNIFLLLCAILLSSCTKLRDEEANQFNNYAIEPMYACCIDSKQIFSEGFVTLYTYDNHNNSYAIWNDTKGKSFIVKTGENSEIATEISKGSNNCSIKCLAIDSDGNIVTFIDNNSLSDRYSVRIYDKTTFEEKKYEMTDSHIYDMEDFFNCSYINGELFLYNFNTILKYNNNFEFSGEMISEKYIEKVIQGSNEKIYAVGSGLIMEIDTNEMSIINTITFEIDLDCHSYFPGYGEYIIYAADNVCIYGIKQDGSIDVLSNLSSYGLNGSDLYDCYVDSSGKIWFIENGEYGSSLSNLEFIPINKFNERTKVIIMASDSVGNGFEQVVRSYNKSSKEYCVEFEYVDTDETVNQINSFDEKLLSGDKVGDILIFSTKIKNSYSNGLFEDLYNYIDNDESINRIDFFPSALNAMETNDKLYGIWANFSINTYAVPTEYFNYADITFITEAVKNNPDKFVFAESPYINTKSDILKILVKYNFDLFVDYNIPKCDFNNDNMRLLINIAQTFTELNDNNYDEFEKRFSSNKGVFERLTLRGVDDYIIARDAVVGNEKNISVIGIPRLDGKKFHIINGEPLYMNSFSENKEAAWDFIKYFLNYNQNYSRPITSAGIPTLQTVFYENMDKRLKYNKLLKEKYNDNYCEYFFNNRPLKLADEEDYNTLLDIINSSKAVTYDDDILNIIEEETALLWEGYVTVDDAIENIQSRASIVVNEKY